MQLRVCPAQRVPELLPGALQGEYVLAPYLNEPSFESEKRIEYDQAAVLISTSGSTGNPKHVVLSRDGIEWAALANQGYFGGPGTWHLALSAHYVAGLMVVARAWFAGTKLRQAGPKMDQLELAQGRNYLSIVPAQLFEALGRPDLVTKLAKLDGILLGGGSVDPQVLNRAKEFGLKIVTTYGMSETCGGVVYNGEPLTGVQITLADELVHLTSPSAFLGYLDDPELTRKVLDGQTVKTTDRGFFDSSGRLKIIGRADDLIKSGGVTVDLAVVQRAVDACLVANPEAGRTCVVGAPDPKWSTVVTLVTEGDKSTGWWRERLAAECGLSRINYSREGGAESDRSGLNPPRLDRRWLPRQVIRVEKVVLTASGKLDRAANLAQLDV